MVALARARLALSGTLGLFLLCGCAEEILKTPVPNQPPQTHISSDLPRPYERTSYRVHLNWIGEDADGLIAGYYYAWDDTLDEQGNPTWRFISVSESTFVVSASTCPDPPCEGPYEPFFGYHTFWVKAVDDQGLMDPTPAHRTFTATTIAPEAEIVVGPPTICVGCLQSPEYVYMEWRGSDPDGDIAGYWYKWYVAFGEHPYSGGPDPRERGWIFVPPESTSAAGRVSARSQGCVDGGEASFAVFAVDDAGAVQQVASCPTPADPGNWECFCPDPEVGSSGLCIDGGLLGVRSSSGHLCDVLTGRQGTYDRDLYSFDTVTGVFAGTGVPFRWNRLESGAGTAPLLGYRYAVDDPGAWARPISREVTQFPDSARPDTIFGPGVHRFYVEAVDRAGGSDVGVLRFLVTAGPTRSDPPTMPRILYVDDNGNRDNNYSEWQQFQRPPSEPEFEDVFWNALLSGYRYDQFDTQVEGRAPLVPLVAQYTTVIWNTGIPGVEGCHLRDDLFGPRAEYLSSYVRAGGNVLLLGMCPLLALVVSCPSTGLLGDMCCNTPSKGPWFYFDPYACGRGSAETYQHFLLAQLGVEQMRVPLSHAPIGSGYWQITPDRVLQGCRPVDPAGLFLRYLDVDSLKTGGPRDNPPGGLDAVDLVPAVNVTLRSAMESWVTPLYFADYADPDMDPYEVIGLLARGNDNPRKPLTDPDWGNVVFLGLQPFFFKQADAAWFVQTVLTDVFGEQREE